MLCNHDYCIAKSKSPLIRSWSAFDEEKGLINKIFTTGIIGLIWYEVQAYFTYGDHYVKFDLRLEFARVFPNELDENLEYVIENAQTRNGFYG